MSKNELPERLERARCIVHETVANDPYATSLVAAVPGGQQRAMRWIDWIFGIGAVELTGTFPPDLMKAVWYAVTSGINGAYGISGGSVLEFDFVAAPLPEDEAGPRGDTFTWGPADSTSRPFPVQKHPFLI